MEPITDSHAENQLVGGRSKTSVTYKGDQHKRVKTERFECEERIYASKDVMGLLTKWFCSSLFFTLVWHPDIWKQYVSVYEKEIE